ncbi:hypothetical protein J3R82DRAFT_1418 [Butyriboletus roseoflavus]|nr:hypothetical protein J3R82DRAFT_1418 [Butyriboletus roseoflavus]
MPPKTFREAESIYDRATNLEFVADFESAFHLYLEATDAFLHLSRSATATPAFQAQCKASAAKAIQRAEKIRKASKTPGAQISVVAAPIDSFGSEYQAYVLRKSSTVNNVRYPLWKEPVPLPLKPGTHYSDPNGQPSPPLPKTTSSTTITWKRPSFDIFTFFELSLTLTPSDINQTFTGDCSVCASVAVCIQHNQRFNSRLLSSSLFPGNQPGRYDLKAYLNGDCRRVPIDDLLPFDDSGRPVGVSSGGKAFAWPALIEKAYLKLMGGYDFPGSNSSVDLRILTGWIPEHIELQSTSFERERTWERLANGFRNGHCVVTTGTDTKTLLKIEGVKLLPGHDYAVVGIRETESERWFTLVNSTVPVTSSSFHAERENRSSPNNSRLLDMRWDSICATFEGIYTSWDPGLFQYDAIHHDVWKPSDTDDKVQTSVRHLRLRYECQMSPDRGGGTLDMSKDVWVLLTRHLSHTRRGAEYISLAVHPEDEDDWRDIWVRTGNTEGPYTTSPYVLVKTKVGEGFPTLPSPSVSRPKISGALSIFASYDGPFDDVFFTVNVYCGADVKASWDGDSGIEDLISPRGSGFSIKVDGTLTTKNAGGNHTHPTYMLNPQWHLRIYDENASSSGVGAFTSGGKASPLKGFVENSKIVAVGEKNKTGQKSVVVLSAQGPREVPLNVTAVWSSGKRIFELAQKEVVASSGAYTYGRARAAEDMASGDYTVILSAFEPQIHLGQFTLKVESSRKVDLTPIPQEGAGMYARVSKGEW